MKIAYVIDALQTEGAGTESQLRLLIEGMQARGHQVSLYVLRHTDFSRHCDYPCEIESVGFDSFFSPISWIQAWRFRRHLVLEQIDVLHGFFNDVALLVPLLLGFSKLKRFTSRRDMGIWYSFFKLLILRLNALTQCDVVCNSNAVVAHTSQLEWLAAEKLHCVYNAAPQSSTEVLNEQAQQFQAQLESRSSVTICLVANLKPLKQIETLIEAAKLVAENNNHRVEYHLIGKVLDPHYASELKILIEEYGLTGNFHFDGPIPEIRRILSAFDIGVLSSASEGLSNTVIEYLHSGLPALVSETGGNPEIITHGDNGFLFAPGDARQLADHLDALLKNTELRQQLGQRATASVSRFNVETMCEGYEQLYSGQTS